MTTAEQFRAIVAPREVAIAGVPWPYYKVVALVAGFAVLLIVGVVTLNATAGVLAGAAVGTAAWLALGALAPWCGAKRARR